MALRIAFPIDLTTTRADEHLGTSQPGIEPGGHRRQQLPGLVDTQLQIGSWRPARWLKDLEVVEDRAGTVVGPL